MRLFNNVNAEIVTYCIKVFLGIMALLCIVALYESVQTFNVEKYKTNTPLLDTRATPSSTSIFLRNDYRNGVTPVDIPEPGRFLGTDSNHATFAVDVTSAEVEDPHREAKLQVYNAASKSLRHETYASGCSNVSRNNVVYCHNGQRSHVTAYHMFTGKSMFSFPTPDADAHFELLGTGRQGDIIVARNSEDGPATTNTLYSITGNSIRWSKKLHPNERCNAIHRNRILLCHQPAGGGPGAVDIRTLQVSDGAELTNHHADTRIAITSGGWIEFPPETPDTEQPTTTAARKPAEPYQVYDAYGRHQGKSRSSGVDTFFPYNTDRNLGNSETLTYPAHSIAGMEAQDSGVVSANGTITYRGAMDNDGKTKHFFRLDSADKQFSFAAANLLTGSWDGTLLLVRTEEGTPAHSVKYQIFDTTNENSMDIIETVDSTPQVINGTLAITHKAEDSDEYGKLTVFLPER